MTPLELWKRYNACLCRVPAVDLTLDISRMEFGEDYLASMELPIGRAFDAMDALEGGDIANPDEKRMVGHYWLRAPERAPDQAITDAIVACREQVREFARKVHVREVRPVKADRFTDVLMIGIGGSALGPMLAADALGTASDRMRMHFLDNTDPDGIAHTLDGLGARLKSTLAVVVSKSGGTPETYNGMTLAAAAWQRAGLTFGKHAAAVTKAGSRLHQDAEGWLQRFPMFDWVGGRTSELSAVGLLPAALQGIDIAAMLEGAAACDQATRVRDARRNPAALLALMWHCATGGAGKKDMVVLPYKDRLLLFSRYLQQLVMESLGKEFDLAGRRVNQGISVYGNKGSTDQHAYVQQLREGVNNFFVTFIRVLEDGGSGEAVKDGMTAGDYLHGFLMGTREALAGNGRQSMTITVRRVDARTLGALIALFERAVGLYASLVEINAYHQPGVEAGKKAAGSVLDLQKKVEAQLKDTGQTAAQIAAAIGEKDAVESVFWILQHLEANGRASLTAGDGPESDRFSRAAASR